MADLNLLAATGFGRGIAGLDVGIIVVFLVVSTLFAIMMKGRQAGVRDFFLSNRDLPWVVVCLSLIATEISAAGFVGVPYGAFSGSLVYLQLAIGAILARFIIGYYFIPAFYNGEFYSPYQYIGQRLGIGAERMSRVLFMVGAVLGQAVRVFIVAVVLEVITGVPVLWSILVITAFAVLWTVIGGIRTVVWTDVIQIVVIVAAAVAAGIFLIAQTSGGMAEIFRTASEAGKLKLLDFRFDHLLELTIWTGLFGSTFNVLASHGADQMNTQRLFCCRDAGDARKAILWSGLSQVVVLLLLCLGLGLFCYWGQHAQEFIDRSVGIGQRHAFPLFIAAVMPAGLKGLLIIGLLAAAISSLNSALAALAQTTTPCPNGDSTVSGDDKAQVHRARWHTLGWGALLALVALYCHSVVLIDVVVGSALKMTTFTYGALLGALLLAFVPHHRDGRGLLLAAPIAALAAFGTSLHDPWTDWVVVLGVVLVFAGWFYSLFHEIEELNEIKDQDQYVRRAWYVLLAEIPRTIWVLAGAGLVLYVHFGYTWTVTAGVDTPQGIAWPWYLPMGTGITVILGYLLSRPRMEKV